MEIFKVVLSFVVSVLANKSSELPGFLFGKEDIQEKLERTYRDAILKWNVPNGLKEACLNGSMEHRLEALKDYFVHKEKGRAPQEKQFLELWTKQIMADSDCSAFLVTNQAEFYHKETLESIRELHDLFLEILASQKELSYQGTETCERFWSRKSIAENLTLPYSIVLGGREEAKSKVEEAFKTNRVVYIKATTALEAKMFAVASVLNYDNEVPIRTVIVEDTGTYEKISDEIDSSIIITTITEDAPWKACKNGHSVIVCVSNREIGVPEDAVELPPIDRDSFIQALKDAGLEDSKARLMASDAAYAINNLLRDLHIKQPNKQWTLPENRRILFPALLIGAWYEPNTKDTEIVSAVANMPYDDFKQRLREIISVDESPFVKIGNEWRVATPKGMLSLYKNDISEDLIDRFLSNASLIIEDDDPDAVAGVNALELPIGEAKCQYSNAIKRGVYHTITLLSILLDERSIVRRKIKACLQSKLEGFDLPRYLSNSRNIRWIAEAEPEFFLEYAENDINRGAPIISRLFKEDNCFDFWTSDVSHVELLWCLEAIAWNAELLPRATAILLHCCQYPLSQRCGNRPINSLEKIYMCIFPQTQADAKTRYGILKSLSSRYRKEVYDLCYLLMRGVGMEQHRIDCSNTFRWRWKEQNQEPTLCAVTREDVEQLLDLIEITCPYSNDNIKELLMLSTNRTFYFCRTRILNLVSPHIVNHIGDEDIIHTLRHDIISWHKSCRKTVWALNDEALKPYEDMLSAIESQDIITQNKQYFESMWLRDYNLDDPKADMEYSKRVRTEKIRAIIDKCTIDGVWQLAAVAESQDAVANALAEATKDAYIKEVYQKYINDTISVRFVKRYFHDIFYLLGGTTYQSIVETLRTVDENKFAIVLYAPSYYKSLSSIADGLNGEIQDEYWNKVEILQMEADEVTPIIKRLCKARRHEYLLQDVLLQDVFDIKESDKIAVLIDALHSNNLEKFRMHRYELSELLKTITLPQSEPERTELLTVERLLYKDLELYIPGMSLHLIKVLNDSPELMMEMVKLYYTDNDVFFSQYHYVPCSNEDGLIDYNRLREYLLLLKQMMIENGVVEHVSYVFGKIISNIPESEDYPCEAMCRMVDEFADDGIDSAIGSALFNRRGASTRSPYSGGIVERYHIKVLEKYKSRASMHCCPRLVKVFNKEIQCFEEIARMEDEQALRFKLMI